MKLNTIYYLIGEVVSKVSPFILLPLISNLYGLSAVSDYSNAIIISNVIQILLSGWVVSYVSVVFFRSKLKYKFNLTVGLVICVAFVSLMLPVAFFLFLYRSEYEIISLGVIIGGLSGISTLYLITRQVEGKVREYIFFNITKSVSILTVSLLFIYLYQGSNIVSLLIINAALSLMFNIVAVYILKEERKLKPIFLSFKSSFSGAVSFGFPLLPGIMLSPLKTSVDRLVIIAFISLEFSGVYAVGYQFSLVVSIVSMAYIKAITPSLLDALTKSDKVVVRGLFANYCALVIVSAFLVSLFFLLFGSYFIGDGSVNIHLICIFIAAISIQNISSFFTCYYQVYNKTNALMMITIFSFILYGVFVTIGAFVSDVMFVFSSILAVLISGVILYCKGFKNVI